MEESQRRGGRMNKSEIVRKECIAHHYWRHMDDPKCFFKVMPGDFKNRMTIPKKFVANIREKIYEQVTLEVPNGKAYTVEVANEQQYKLVLRSGWAEFTSAYEIELGDLLVFENSGSSHFKVRILDRSGCEKDLPCFLLDSLPCPCMQERKGSHGKQMQSPTGKRMSVGSPSSTIRKTPKMDPTDSPSSQKKTEHVPSSEGIHQEPINSGASQKAIKSCIVLPAGCSMTSEQEAKVIALEQKIQPKIPFYITAMYKESLASGILQISKKYFMEHVTNENGTIQLCQVDGSNVWTINLYIISDPHYAVSTGWLEFIRDNKLGEGDIFIFQRTRSKNGRVKLIFRTLEGSCCLQPPGHVPPTKRHGVAKPPSMLTRHTSVTDEQRSKVEERGGAIKSETPKMNPTDCPSQKKRHVSPTKRDDGATKPPYMLPRYTSLTYEQSSKVNEKGGAIQSETPKMNATDCLSQKKRHVSPTKMDGAAKPPYMLPRYTSLTEEQRSEVEEKVGAIRSEIPIYVTVMKNSYVSKRMCYLGISSGYSKYLPGGEEKQLSMGIRLRHKDDAWEAEFQVKYGRQQIHGKGWRKFVTDNRLKPDDICLFNLVNNTNTLTMDVHIIRKRSVELPAGRHD